MLFSSKIYSLFSVLRGGGFISEGRKLRKVHRESRIIRDEETQIKGVAFILLWESHELGVIGTGQKR